MDEKEFTYDMLMQSFKESREEIREMRAAAAQRAAEYEKAREKSNADFEKQMKELREQQKENARMFKEIGERIDATNKSVFGISESNGAMAEEVIFNSLKQDMIFAGIEFYDITANMSRKIRAQKLEGEYDIVLTNGDTIAIVETKYKVRPEDITKLVDENVEKFRKLFPEFNGYKIVLGVGGMSFEKRAITEAKNKGVGIIKIVGDKVEFHTDGIRIY